MFRKSITHLNLSAWSETMSFVRIPLALLVVFIHVYNCMDVYPTDVFKPYMHESTCAVSYVMLLLSRGVAVFAVPVFFFISGYLFFCKVETFGRKEYSEKMKRKMQTLVLPYLFWNVLALFLYVVKIRHSLSVGTIVSILQGFWVRDSFVGDYFLCDKPTTPELYAFWFIRDLLVMMLVSPVIYRVVKHKICRFLFLLFLILEWLFAFFPYYVCPGISVPALLFFTAGAVLGVEKKIWLPSGFFQMSLLLIVAILCLVAYMASLYESGENVTSVFYGLNVIIGSFAALFAVYQGCRKGKLKFRLKNAATFAFVIYAFHPLIVNRCLGLVAKIMFSACSVNQFSVLVAYLATFLLTVVACWMLHKGVCVNKRLLLLVTGRR